MKYILFLCFIFSIQRSVAQAVVHYYDGTPALEVKHTDVEGSELLYHDWYNGTLKTKEGKVISGVRLKYNLLEDQVYYLDKGNVSMKLITQLQEFTIGDSANGIKPKTFRNDYSVAKKPTGSNFFEVLADGKITLLKKTLKNIIETKEYNSSVTKKQIIDDVQYYLVNDGNTYQLKKDKQAIKLAFKGKLKMLKLISQHKKSI